MQTEQEINEAIFDSGCNYQKEYDWTLQFSFTHRFDYERFYLGYCAYAFIGKVMVSVMKKDYDMTIREYATREHREVIMSDIFKSIIHGLKENALLNGYTLSDKYEVIYLK